MFTACVQGRENGFGRDSFNCNYCEVHTRDLHLLTPSPARTLSRQYQQSHCFDPTDPRPFQCPCCLKTFSSQSDLLAESPPVDAREFADRHFGQNWHQPPLLHIEPERYIVCVLHLLLSCTKLIFRKGILEILETEEQASTLNARLQNLQICVPKQRKLSARVAHDQSSRVKFTGKECVILLEAWDVIIDEVLSKSPDRDKWNEHARQT